MYFCIINKQTMKAYEKVKFKFNTFLTSQQLEENGYIQACISGTVPHFQSLAVPLSAESLS
jgi:hypothetical protein